MSNHTPGLWKVRKRMVPVIDSEAFVWDGNYIIFDGDVAIAEVSCDDVGTEQATANAKLIASAPELIKALKVIAVWANNPSNNGADYGDIHDLSMETIAKAIGETE